MKVKNAKKSKTSMVAILVFLVVFSAVYIIESELVSIKHSLQHEMKKSEGALYYLNNHVEQLLPENDKILGLDQEIRSLQKKMENRMSEKEVALKTVIAEQKLLRLKMLQAHAAISQHGLNNSIEETHLSQKKDLEAEYLKVEDRPKDNDERQVKESWELVREVKLNNFLKSMKPPNPDFVFHNKLPKSGSSTMNNMIKFIARNGRFNFLKVEPGEIMLHENKRLVEYLKGQIKKPFLLLKHHHFFDFTEFGMEQPTFINVIRDPLEWFTSRFYFSRYGWNRKPGCRDELCGMTEEEKNMTIDECVEKRHPQCTDSSWYYLPYICGSHSVCFNNTSEEAKKKAFEISKRHVMNNYFVVGVLEQFEETLMMLNLLLPQYFEGAVNIWKGAYLQHIQVLTKTQHKQPMSEKSRKFFLEGPLKYEKKFYDFTRKVFNERLKHYGIKAAPPPEDDDIY